MLRNFLILFFLLHFSTKAGVLGYFSSKCLSYGQNYIMQYNTDCDGINTVYFFNKKEIKDDDLYKCNLSTYKPIRKITSWDFIDNTLIEREGKILWASEIYRQLHPEYPSDKAIDFTDSFLALKENDNIITFTLSSRTAPTACTTEGIIFLKNYGAMKNGQVIQGVFNKETNEICENICDRELPDEKIKKICEKQPYYDDNTKNMWDQLRAYGLTPVVYKIKCTNIMTGKTSHSELKCGTEQ